MSDLAFYKFFINDWMMGRIQKCSGDAVKSFVNFTCIYWNKNCEISYEDAELELGEHLEELLKYRVIERDNDMIRIKFLERQMHEVTEKASASSVSGRVGNLKRWHSDIYKLYRDGKISLTQAEEMAKQSGGDKGAITTQSQNIAEEEEEEEEEEDKEEELLGKPKRNIAQKRKCELFETWWDLYGKKVDKKRAEQKWLALTQAEKEKCLEVVEDYVKSTDDVTFRKHPKTYLENRSWENEIILPQTPPKPKTNGVTYGRVASPF